jgi:hypothetical protein
VGRKLSTPATAFCLKVPTLQRPARCTHSRVVRLFCWRLTILVISLNSPKVATVSHFWCGRKCCRSCAPRRFDLLVILIVPGEAAGIRFIGPRPETIALLGDKVPQLSQAWNVENADIVNMCRLGKWWEFSGSTICTSQTISPKDSNLFNLVKGQTSRPWTQVLS